MSGTQDLTGVATWQSSNSTVATVSGGLVRAIAPGAVTISAQSQQQTASAQLTVAQDDDCLPYDSANLSIFENTNDQPSPSWTITAPYQSGYALLAGADTLTDANNLLAVYQRYNQSCFVGRGNGRPNRLQYIVTYFMSPTGRRTTIAPEDCVAYSASAVQVVSQGATGWAVMSGGTQLALLDTQFEASLVAGVAAQSSNECFIGRGNTRKNPYSYINEYWK
jgi:hypothetical protein